MIKICDFTYKELFELAISRPIMAQIELTKNCNQQCFFCFRSCQPNIKYKDLSINDWMKIVDKLIDIGIEELNFSGGEIFLYNNSQNLFGYAKSKGVKKIVVNTNGQISMSAEMLADVDELIFSIHDIRESHDLATGKVGAFKIAINNFNGVRKIGNVGLGINTVVTPVNIDNLQEIYNYFKDEKLIYHAFNMQINQKSDDHVQFINSVFEKYISFINKIPTHRRKLRHGLQSIICDDVPYQQIPLPNCAGGKYKIVVDFKGDVFPCRYFQNDDYYCGNILTGDARDIWLNGKGFMKFRKIVTNSILPRRCRTCIKNKKCVGGCLAWRKYEPGKKIYQKDLRCKLGNAYIRAGSNNSMQP